MSEAKHTPGPWLIVESMGDRVIETEKGMQIGEVLGDGNSYTIEEEDERFQNARLIAAAPELLSALGDMVSEYPCAENCGESLSCPNNRARAAIAKAKGKQA